MFWHIYRKYLYQLMCNNQNFFASSTDIVTSSLISQTLRALRQNKKFVKIKIDAMFQFCWNHMYIINYTDLYTIVCNYNRSGGTRRSRRIGRDSAVDTPEPEPHMNHGDVTFSLMLTLVSHNPYLKNVLGKMFYSVVICL